jgi:O-antigen/teichoic acid export membrane protein
MFKLNNYIRYEYFKNFIILLSGSITAQLITIFFSPILSRFYEPDQFGIFATYSSFLAIISVICCARFELAIVLPKKISDAVLIFNLCLLISIIIAVLLLPITLFAYFFINVENLEYIFLFPLVTIFSSLNIALIYFHTKLENFKITSISKIIQTSVIGIISLLASYGFRNYGLIIGSCFGQLFCIIYLFVKLPAQYQIKAFNFNEFSSLVKIGREYIQFPKLSLFPSLLNIFTNQSVNFYFVFVFGSIYAGNYFFASKIFLLPASLIGSAFTDIFFQKTNEMRLNNQQLLKFTISNFFYLLFISLIFFFSIYFLSPMFFVNIFGEKWAYAGSLSSFLAFNMLLRLVFSPLTMLFTSLNKVKVGAIWQYFYFITYHLLLLFLFYYNVSFINSIIYLIFFDLAIYIFAFILILHIVMEYDNAIKRLKFKVVI